MFGHSFDDFFTGGNFVGDDGFEQPVDLYRGGGRDVDEDGNVDYDFDPPETVYVIVTDPDADRFEVTGLGPEDDIEHDMAAPARHNITDEDRVVFDDGRGERRPFRVHGARPQRFDGETFIWYRLLADERGEEADAPDDPDDGYGTW